MEKFICGWELRERWNITKEDLAEMILLGELTAYDPATTEPLDIPIERAYLSNLQQTQYTWERNIIPTLYQNASDLCFSFSEITEREENNVLLKKTTAETDTSGKPSNFLIKKGKSWHVGFEGQTVVIPHLVGFFYVDLLLRHPGEALSSITLYHVAYQSSSDLMEFKQASAEGLNIRTKSKIVNKGMPATKKVLLAKYYALKNDFENAESDLERKEIEAETKTIIESIKSEDKQTDSLNQKAQANVNKCINRVRKAIEDAGMTSLAAHLKEHIKADGRYGYIYTGSF